MSALALRTEDLTLVPGEARIRDVVLGERLGFGRSRDIRQIIERNSNELERYAPLAARRRKSRGQDFTEYLLNEPQAVLVCILSRTPAAADVREQVIKVFMAYRHGAVPVAAPDPWQTITERQDILHSAMAFQTDTQAAEFMMMLPHLPAFTRGARRAYPRFWGDKEVFGLLISLHRQVTIDVARAVVAQRCGDGRTPSRSAIGRFWKQLDEVRVAQRPQSMVQ